MTALKTAKELFNEFATSTDGLIVQYESNFIEALIEHDKEIIHLLRRSNVYNRTPYFILGFFTGLTLGLIFLWVLI